MPVNLAVTPRSRANRRIRARSGPSPTNSNVALSTRAAASTACSRAWKRRKLPTHPTTNESRRPELFSNSTRSRLRREQREVDAGRCDENPFVAHAEPMDLFGDDVTATRHQIRGAQRGRFTETLEPCRPSGAPHLPLGRFPDERRRDEHDARDLELPRELQPGHLEEVMALPDETDVAIAPRALRDRP